MCKGVKYKYNRIMTTIESLDVNTLPTIIEQLNKLCIT